MTESAADMVDLVVVLRSGERLTFPVTRERAVGRIDAATGSLSCGGMFALRDTAAFNTDHVAAVFVAERGGAS